MKNQYFGDINDYRKYGILRIILQNEIKVGVCWMLTEDDCKKKDGQKTSYIKKPQMRKYDPILFDSLKTFFEGINNREVSQAEALGILPGALFFYTPLLDDAASRELYFDTMIHEFQSIDLIFFDPDNGLEVKSSKYGTENSSKYLYWCEAVKAYEDGHSLLIYQHFPREKHYTYIAKRCQEIREHLKTAQVQALQTPTVVYFLIPQKEHSDRFDHDLYQIQEQWKGKDKIEVIRNED